MQREPARRVIALSALIPILTFAVMDAAGSVPRGVPTDVGMSAESVERLNHVIDEHLSPGTSPVGIVIANAAASKAVFASTLAV
jgi:hypothetical protein